MKFDFAIGNPPYQDNTVGDNDSYAPPVYNKFMDAAYSVADKVELIHPARFLFDAGSTPKEWNRKMLEDTHFKVLEYEEDCKKIFSNTDIKGGIAITYRDRNKEFGAIEVFVKYRELNGIAKKTSPNTEDDSIMSIIYTQNKFNLEKMYSDYPDLRNNIGSDGKDKRFRNNIFDKIFLFSENKNKNDTIAVIGVIKNVRNWRFINQKYVDIDHENLFKFKVIVPRANGKGLIGDTLSNPIVLKPNEGYTQTFIGIGAFDTKIEAENLLKYVKSKFVRATLSILKVDQHNERDTWKYVPIQNFTRNSDIDWKDTISGIDKQLYKKYSLSKEEIDFIENNVKEME